MTTTLCEKCFPAHAEHECYTMTPVTPCDACGEYGTAGNKAHLFPCDPRLAAHAQTLQPHQQRVVEEHRELNEKIDKLGEFIVNKPGVFLQLPWEEQDLFHRQYAAMQAYSDILVERIAGFAGS